MTVVGFKCVFINESCYRSPNPISAEPLEQRDEEDGLPEKNLPKNQVYHHERENPPRFAAPGSFEFQWGNRCVTAGLRAMFHDKFGGPFNIAQLT